MIARLLQTVVIPLATVNQHDSKVSDFQTGDILCPNAKSTNGCILANTFQSNAAGKPLAVAISTQQQIPSFGNSRICNGSNETNRQRTAVISFFISI